MAVFNKKPKKAVKPKGRSPQIRVTHKAYTKIVFKRLVKVCSVVVILLMGLYVVFAATLLRAVPTTNIGFVPVKNVTYSGGIVPKDAQVLVNMDKKQGIEFMDRLKQSFVPTSDAAIIQIVAGPYGKMHWTEPDILSVDGYPTNVSLAPEEGEKSPLESRESEYLEDEYLAICVKGACGEAGSGLIISKDNIMGSPLSKETVDKVVAGE